MSTVNHDDPTAAHRSSIRLDAAPRTSFDELDLDSAIRDLEPAASDDDG